MQFNMFAIRDDQGGLTAYGSVARDLRDVRKANLRRAALLELSDRLRDVESITEMAYIAAEITGHAMEVSAAGFGTVGLDGDSVYIERDWTAPGVCQRRRRPPDGRLRLLHRGFATRRRRRHQ